MSETASVQWKNVLPPRMLEQLGIGSFVLQAISESIAGTTMQILSMTDLSKEDKAQIIAALIQKFPVTTNQDGVKTWIREYQLTPEIFMHLKYHSNGRCPILEIKLYDQSKSLIGRYKDLRLSGIEEECSINTIPYDEVLTMLLQDDENS